MNTIKNYIVVLLAGLIGSASLSGAANDATFARALAHSMPKKVSQIGALALGAGAIGGLGYYAWRTWNYKAPVEQPQIQQAAEEDAKRTAASPTPTALLDTTDEGSSSVLSEIEKLKRNLADELEQLKKDDQAAKEEFQITKEAIQKMQVNKEAIQKMQNMITIELDSAKRFREEQRAKRAQQFERTTSLQRDNERLQQDIDEARRAVVTARSESGPFQHYKEFSRLQIEQLSKKHEAELAAKLKTAEEQRLAAIRRLESERDTARDFLAGMRAERDVLAKQQQLVQSRVSEDDGKRSAAAVHTNGHANGSTHHISVHVQSPQQPMPTVPNGKTIQQHTHYYGDPSLIQKIRKYVLCGVVSIIGGFWALQSPEQPWNRQRMHQ